MISVLLASVVLGCSVAVRTIRVGNSGLGVFQASSVFGEYQQGDVVVREGSRDFIRLAQFNRYPQLILQAVLK
jgi:hypothetical protein